MGEPILAPKDTWFTQGGTSVKRASITQIDIKNSYTPTGTVTSSWDASAAKDGSVMVYVEGTKLTIAGNGSGKIYANPDSSCAFCDINNANEPFSNVTVINGIALLDTSKVTSMRNMFRSMSKLTAIDVSNFDTSKVTDMLGMFNSCSTITTLNVGDWDTSASTTMNGMFSNCTSLRELDVSKWNTSEVNNMKQTFKKCSSLETLNVSGWNTGKVTTMLEMFYGDTSLRVLDVSKWDVSNVTTMRLMFSAVDVDNYMNLLELDVSNWNTSSVVDMSAMFQGCDQLKTLDVSKWDVSNVTNMKSMFYVCSQLKVIDLSNWDVSKVTTMDSMFADCYKLESVNMHGWNTESLTNICCMFNDAQSLKTLDVSCFNTSSVTEMNQFVERCKSLTSIIGLDKWDTSKATSLQEMFEDCQNLTELDLSTWDTSSVDNMFEMFSGCSNLKTIYVSDKWTTANLSSQLFEDMFNNDPTYAEFYGYCPKDRIFYGCENLVGGAGTSYTNSHINYTTNNNDSTYACIDNGTNNPGYLTNIDDSSPLLIKTGTLHKVGVSMRSVTGETSKCKPSEMVDALKSASSEVHTQANLISQIVNALDGKASNSGGIDTSDATATAADILLDKTAYVNGEKITGTIATKTSSNLTTSGKTVTVPAGYYASQVTKDVSTATQATPSISVNSSGLITASATQTAGYVAAGTKSATKQLTTQAAKTVTPTASAQTAVASGTYTTGAVTVAGDANLVASNIRNGVSIFGVSGSYEGDKGIDTSDATATAGDILSGKTAYVDGAKITGNIATKTASNLSASGKTVTVPAGYYASQVTKDVATATQATPSVSIDSAGLITASATQTAGYVAAGTKSGTKQLTVQAAKTVTPTTSNQTAVASGRYTTGAITVKGDANLVAANIAAGKTIFGVTGTHAGLESAAQETWTITLMNGSTTTKVVYVE